MKIAFSEVKDPADESYFRSRLSELGRHEVTFFFGVADEEKGPFDAEISSIFINTKADREFFNRHPKLRLLTTRSTGYDHIDLTVAGNRGVVVCNVPTYGENTVAEHTFALILSLSRHLKKAYAKTLRSDFSLEDLMGFDLKGKTLGVVGTGRIGLHVIRIAVSFGMNVVAYDVKRETFLEEVLNFDYVSLDELLAQSDIVSLHVPSIPSTHHLINASTLSRVKRGAVLINTARGSLVDTDALVNALDEGILSGAGLDVLEEEELILEEKRYARAASANDWEKLKTTLKNHVLLARENVVYTPHMAFYSREAVRRIADITLANIRAFLAGHPVNQVGSVRAI